ncbi:MAG: helix-turn-helix domain-containing protein [Firmicutes bacterium]|nr:helix-turn-helix domain-containing protein [Bacillota bacterium]
MAYTKFGEFVRILRIKNHEVMGDMAKVLGTSLPFLSAVENGKKNVPKEWIPKLVTHYRLTLEEEIELDQSIEDSKTQMKLNLVNSSNNQRLAALQFARSFDGMDDETAIKIIKLLEKGEVH